MKFKIKSSTSDCASTSEPLSFEVKSTQSSDSPVVSWNDIIGKPSCFNPCTPDGDLLSWNSTILAITNGENKVESDVTFSLTQSSSVGSGYLSSTDWNTFNDKFDQPTGSTSDYIRGDGSIAPFPSFASTYFAQGGNTFGADANLGTNDNFGLNFKTNNTTRGGFSNSGVFTILNLTSANAGIVKASTGGALSKVDLSNTTTDYLGGDGAFHPLPSSLMLTFQNGINNSLGVVRLGGPLTTNTNITTDGFSLTFTQASSRSLVIGDDGSLKANATTTNPGFQYSPTFYNSGAGIGISALGAVIIPQATLQIRTSSDSISHKAIRVESTDGSVELFSVKNNGEGFFNSNLLLTTGAAIKASNQVTIGAMLVSNGAINYINNAANVYATWDYANSKFVVNGQGRAIFGTASSSNTARVYIEGYSTGSLTSSLDVRPLGGGTSYFRVQDDGVSIFNGAVAVNKTNANWTLDVNGSIRAFHTDGFYGATSGNVMQYRLYSNGSGSTILDRVSPSNLWFAQAGVTQAQLDTSGGWTVNGLAGVGTRLATVNSTGLFGSTTASAFGLVETSRLLNFNGVSQDLSADRSWRMSMADTGALTYAGISVASATTVNIGACTGIVVDNETDPLNPTYVTVTYAGETNKVVPTIGSATGTYVLLRSDGVIHFQTTYPTSSQRKTHIYLSKISHPNLTSISFAIDEVDFITSPTAQFRDLFQAITYINTGVTATPNANLTIANTAGTILGNGIYFVTDKTRPNNYPVASSATTSFLVLNQSGATGSFTTAVDPANYDVGGVTTPVGGGTLRSTLQYLWYAPGAGFALQRGQTVYDTLVDAIAAVGRESFVVRPNLIGNSILIGVWAMRHTTTNLSDTTFARFFPSDKFGQVGGSSSGISTATFQTTYNNSSIPQILLNAQGAFTIRNSGSYGADTLALQQWQNIAGTTTASINGNGGGYFGYDTEVKGILYITSPISAGGSYATDSDSRVVIKRTTDLSTNSNAHGFVDATIFQRTTPGLANNAYTDNGKIIGSTNYDHHASFQVAFTYEGSGTTTNQYGFVDVLRVNAGAKVTNRYGINIFNPIGGGIINNNYGVYVKTQTASAASYAFYAETNNSFFGGPTTRFGNLINKQFTINTEFSGSGELPVGIFLSPEDNANLVLMPSTSGTSGNKLVMGYYNGSSFKSALEFTHTTGGAGTNLLLVKDGNGKVGIGKTPDTGAMLDVNGATKTLYTSGFYLTNGTTMNSRWYHDGSTSIIMDRIASTSMQWQQAGVTQMMLASTGSVSIGSTTTTSLFNVGSSAQFQVSSTGNISTSGIASIFSGDIRTITGGNVGGAGGSVYFGANSGTTSFGAQIKSSLVYYSLPNEAAHLDFLTRDYTGSLGTLTTRMRIASNGNVSIGSTTTTSLFNVGTSAQFQVSSAGNVALGAVPTTTQNFRNRQNITGATTAYGIYNDPIVQSGVTNNAFGFYSQIYTANTAFTLTTLDNFFVDNPSVGAGSAITNVYGFRVTALTAGTNNYAFRGQVSSGAGRWNVYMDGTAANYFEGSVGIGTATIFGKVEIDSGLPSSIPTNADTTSGVIVSDGGNIMLRMGVANLSASGGGFPSYIQAQNKTLSNTYNLFLNPLGGNVSVGSTTATSLFNVGSSAQFQVTSAGNVSTSGTISTTNTLNVGSTSSFGDTITNTKSVSGNYTSYIGRNSESTNTAEVQFRHQVFNGTDALLIRTSTRNAPSWGSVYSTWFAGVQGSSKLYFSGGNAASPQIYIDEAGQFVNLTSNIVTLDTAGFYLSTAPGLMQSRWYSNGTNIIWNKSSAMSGSYIWQNSGAAQMALEGSTGNLGINNAGATTYGKLQVHNTLNNYSFVHVSDSGASGFRTYGFRGITGLTGRFTLDALNDAGVFQRALMTWEHSTGNVSIGSTTMTSLFNVGTSAQFQVSSTGNVTTTADITMTTAATTGKWYQDANGVVFSSETSGAKIRWLTNPTGGAVERMRLTEAGNLTIGSTVATSLFNVGTTNQLQITSAGSLSTSGTISTTNSATISGLLTMGDQIISNKSVAGSFLFLRAFNTNNAGGTSNLTQFRMDRYDGTLGFDIRTHSGGDTPTWGVATSTWIRTSQATARLYLSGGNAANPHVYIDENGNFVNTTLATKTLYTAGFYLDNAGSERSRWYESSSNVIINRITGTGFKLQQNNTDQFEITTGGTFRMTHTTSLAYLQYANGSDVVLVGQTAAGGGVSYNAINATTTGSASFGLSDQSASLSLLATVYNNAYTATSLGAKALTNTAVLEFVKEGLLVYGASGLSVYTSGGTQALRFDSSARTIAVGELWSNNGTWKQFFNGAAESWILHESNTRSIFETRGTNLAAGSVDSLWYTDVAYMSIKNFGSSYTPSGLATPSTTLITTGTTTNVNVANASGTYNVYINSVLKQRWDTGGTILSGNLTLDTVGTGIKIKEGTNATMGRATLAAGTVTVNTTKVTANSEIFITIQSLGTVTAPKSMAITARTAGASFVITSEDVTDTSVVSWIIVEPS